jgi:type I restriction enzyme R subunit
VIETAQMSGELIPLARDMRQASARGAAPNDVAVKAFGDEMLPAIAREMAATVRKNVTIDWSIRKILSAQLRVLVKRGLRKHGYAPDKQERAR